MCKSNCIKYNNSTNTLQSINAKKFCMTNLNILDLLLKSNIAEHNRIKLLLLTANSLSFSSQKAPWDSQKIEYTTKNLLAVNYKLEDGYPISQNINATSLENENLHKLSRHSFFTTHILFRQSVLKSLYPFPYGQKSIQIMNNNF